VVVIAVPRRFRGVTLSALNGTFEEVAREEKLRFRFGAMVKNLKVMNISCKQIIAFLEGIQKLCSYQYYFGNSGLTYSYDLQRLN